MSRAAESVTVVIVTFNSAEVVGACLDALPAGLGDVPATVCIVDNDSDDESLGVVAATNLQAQVIRLGENRGYAAAINAGVAAAPASSSILVLNPDIRLQEGCADRLILALRTPGVGIAVPKLVDAEGELQFSQRRDPSAVRTLGEAVLGGRRAGGLRRLGEVVTTRAAYARTRSVDWASGAAMLISRECWDAVGSWDESFLLYSEETEYCQRVRAAGWEVRFVPDAVAVHLGGELSQSPKLRRLLVRNKLRLYARTHPLPNRAAFRAAVIANEASRALAGSAPHRAGLREALRSQPSRPPRVAEPPPRPGYVFFSAQDYWYHNRAHSDVQLARGLARSRRVLLVNSLGMRMPTPGKTTQVGRRIARKLDSMRHLLRQPEPDLPDLYVFSPIVLPLYGNRALRSLNAALVRAQVRLAEQRLRIEAPHVIVTIPTAWDVARALPHSRLIVNRSDKYSAFAETNSAAMQALEVEMLAAADAAVYVNHALMEEEQPLLREGGVAVFLGHGVDFELFGAPNSAADVPPDIAAIPRPRVGFFGGLNDYVVDFKLIARLAEEVPDANIVLIGKATCDLGFLRSFPNVHLLGPRAYPQIPRYGAGFDVAIMPWLQNEWINNCNPIKVKEYLALGLPVVSMYYPESRALEGLIAIGKDHEEFIQLVRAALAGHGVSTAEDRRRSVSGDTWQSRSDLLLRLAETSPENVR